MEHVVHISDLGRVEAERLVERLRALCRVERRACDAGRGTAQEREGVGWRRRNQHARVGPDSGMGARARAECTWNMKPMLVTLDVSKLSGWLNASVPCRVKRRACDVGRGTAQEREGVGWRRRNRHPRGGPDSRLGGGRARAERTWNMAYMVVTLDVSKLSDWLNADAFCRVKRRACDVGRGTAREAGGRWVAAMQAACTGRA